MLITRFTYQIQCLFCKGAQILGKQNQRLSAYILLSLAGCAIALVPTDAVAHSEADKARFVSSQGSDQGFCNNRFRPCATIDYAVMQANKGDKILVAQGHYQVTSAESLVYLVSDILPVFGGYNLSDNYQNQSPDQFITSISGVPEHYAATVYERGFHVLSDTKGVGDSALERGLKSIALMKSTQTASDCSNQTTDGFACSNISLLGRVPLNTLPTGSGAANDIWGHVDLNDMREYALIGLQRGLAVVDVTQAEAPVVVGSISGQSTTWRDIKVFQYYDNNARRFKAYAYASADSVTEGLTIVDLSQLPASISLISRETIDLQSHNVYISNVNYTTNTALPNTNALLHVTGSRNFGGAWRTFSLETPKQPLTAYTPNTTNRSDYTHDASSLLITDSRVQTDCNITNTGTCSVMLDFNEQEVILWQHNEANSAVKLSEFTYPNLAYTHSGWWSEDKQYIFVHDELDERNSSLNTTLNIFDISNLQSPMLVGTWRGPTRASDHNGFVKGNKYYMANYERGVTILDISNPASPIEIGFFDTFGASNNASFNGAWGVYPYLPSGNILVSDIQGGLYILRDDTLTSLNDAVGFASPIIMVSEGDSLRVEVQKQGQGDISVDYELLYPSASPNDVQSVSGTLSWTATQTMSQFIDVNINNDDLDEFDELLVIVLNNPKNGDLINAKSHAFVTIEGSAINRGQLNFASEQIDVLETQQSVRFEITRANGNTQALNASVNLISDTALVDEDFSLVGGPDSLQLQWEDGDNSSRHIELLINNDDITENNESFTLEISTADPLVLSGISQVQVTIKDDESNTPPVVNAGNDVQVNTRQNVVLRGATASDDQQPTVALSWEQISGTQVTLRDATGLTPNFTAPASAGLLTFALTATDEFGATDVDQIEVSVIMPVTEPSPPQSSGGVFSVYWMLFILLAWCMRARKQ